MQRKPELRFDIGTTLVIVLLWASAWVVAVHSFEEWLYPVFGPWWTAGGPH